MMKDLTITRIKIGKKKVTLFFHDEKLDITLNTYTDFHLFVGKTLTEKEFKEIENRDALDSYMEYALKSLSVSHVSEKALIEKLTKKGANSKQVNFIVKEMKRLSLIDDDELLDDYLEIAKYKHLGEKRIKEELYKKGISGDKIESLQFDNQLDDAIANLPNLERKYASLNYESRKKHIYDNLIRLGFSYDVASAALLKIKDKDARVENEALKLDVKKAINKYKTKFKGRDLREKVINYLMGKGYKYNDIINNKEIEKL